MFSCVVTDEMCRLCELHCSVWADLNYMSCLSCVDLCELCKLLSGELMQ